MAKGDKKAKNGKRKKDDEKKRPCKRSEICKYLEELTRWLEEDFMPDYTALRIAMCNVEAQAFSGSGVPGKRFPKCSGGTGGDPTPPPPPPKWT